MSTHATLDVRELFNAALSKAHQGMLVMMPKQKQGIMRALDLVTAGNVRNRVVEGVRAGLEVEAEGGLYVFSKGSTSQCECKHDKSESQCLHWLAMRLYEQARHYVDVELAKHERSEAALNSTGELPQPQPEPKELDMAEMDKDIEHEDEEEAQDAQGGPVSLPLQSVMQYQDLVNHEPHSFTIKGITSLGYEFMPCLRGHDLDAVLEDVKKTLRWMRDNKIAGVHGKRPEQEEAASSANGGEQTAPPPPLTPATSETPDGWCAIHRVQMRLNSNDKGSWYSHKLPDGTWCNGKPKKGG